MVERSIWITVRWPGGAERPADLDATAAALRAHRQVDVQGPGWVGVPGKSPNWRRCKVVVAGEDDAELADAIERVVQVVAAALPEVSVGWHPAS